MNNEFTLSGEVIEHIIGIVQQGILKGEDITDDLRKIRVEIDDPDVSRVALSESGSPLSDVVFTRVGQIVNESWMTGTSLVDHLRMVKVEEHEAQFTLTNEYMGMVETNLRKQAEEGEQLKETHIIRGQD